MRRERSKKDLPGKVPKITEKPARTVANEKKKKLKHFAPKNLETLNKYFSLRRVEIRLENCLAKPKELQGRKITQISADSTARAPRSAWAETRARVVATAARSKTTFMMFSVKF